MRIDPTASSISVHSAWGSAMQHVSERGTGRHPCATGLAAATFVLPFFSLFFLVAESVLPDFLLSSFFPE